MEKTPHVKVALVRSSVAKIIIRLMVQILDSVVVLHCIIFPSFFRGMFAGGLREMQQTEIPIHGVTHTAITKLLDFIYTSELELDLYTVQEVLCAATLLQVNPPPWSSVSAANRSET